jgi:hypothetical protein
MSDNEGNFKLFAVTYLSPSLVALPSNTNRNNPICVALPKAAKASTVRTTRIIVAGIVALNFANGNMP